MSESRADYENLVHGIRTELLESIFHLSEQEASAEDRVDAAKPHLLQANEHVGRLISYLELIWNLTETNDGNEISRSELVAIMERVHHHPAEGG